MIFDKISNSEKSSLGSGRCPFCEEWIGSAYLMRRYLNANGQRILVADNITIYRAKYAECRKCLARWPILARDQGGEERKVVEVDRTQEPIGSDVRRVENSTPASVRRMIRASREWRHQIEYGQIKERNYSFGIGGEGEVEAEVKFIVGAEGKLGLNLTAQMERNIQRHYKISAEDKGEFAEEFIVTVPPHTSVEIVLKWNRIWQNGYLEPGLGYAKTPYRYCVGLTFDLQQVPIE